MCTLWAYIKDKVRIKNKASSHNITCPKKKIDHKIYFVFFAVFVNTHLTQGGWHHEKFGQSQFLPPNYDTGRPFHLREKPTWPDLVMLVSQCPSDSRMQSPFRTTVLKLFFTIINYIGDTSLLWLCLMWKENCCLLIFPSTCGENDCCSWAWAYLTTLGKAPGSFWCWQAYPHSATMVPVLTSYSWFELSHYGGWLSVHKNKELKVPQCFSFVFPLLSCRIQILACTPHN